MAEENTNPVPPNNPPVGGVQPGMPGFQPVGVPPATVPQNPVPVPVPPSAAVGVPVQVGVSPAISAPRPVAVATPAAPSSPKSSKTSLLRRHSTVFIIIGFGIAVSSGAGLAKFLLFSKNTQQETIHSAATTKQEVPTIEIKNYEPIPINLNDESITELVNAFADVKIQAEQDRLADLTLSASKPDWEKWTRDVSGAKADIVEKQKELTEDLMIAYQLSIQDADAIRRHLDYDGRWSLGESGSYNSGRWLYEQGIKYFFAGGKDNFATAYANLYAASRLGISAAETPLSIIEPVIGKDSIVTAKSKGTILAESITNEELQPESESAASDDVGSGTIVTTPVQPASSSGAVSTGTGTAKIDTEASQSDTEAGEATDNSANADEEVNDEVGLYDNWQSRSLLPASLLNW